MNANREREKSETVNAKGAKKYEGREIFLRAFRIFSRPSRSL